MPTFQRYDAKGTLIEQKEYTHPFPERATRIQDITTLFRSIQGRLNAIEAAQATIENETTEIDTILAFYDAATAAQKNAANKQIMALLKKTLTRQSAMLQIDSALLRLERLVLLQKGLKEE